MRKIALIAIIFGIFCGVPAHAGNIDCVKYLHIGDNKICLKTLKETSPALMAEFDNTVYYASTTTENYSKVKFEYNGKQYSIFNHDDIEYELIHWLSGTDELIDGVWHDRIVIDGALNFKNNGCTWNDAHDGYYSADGLKQYFQTISVPTLDFGTDWYATVVAQVDAPLGTSCYVIDFGALGNA